jgi:L-lysine exporter family protein LysE/ArgO
MLSSYLSGLGLGGSMIMAIGAQNTHVLKSGLKRDHIGLTVLVCILVDVVLLCIGVAGVGELIQQSAGLLAVARWGGASFLLWYGLRSWYAALSAGAMEISVKENASGAKVALISVLTLSLLNPHVYLDTVVLLGSIGGQFPENERVGFVLGAITASICWFCALGFGARKLAHLFSKPVMWKCIDIVSGCIMIALSALIAFAV